MVLLRLRWWWWWWWFGATGSIVLDDDLEALSPLFLLSLVFPCGAGALFFAIAPTSHPPHTLPLPSPFFAFC